MGSDMCIRDRPGSVRNVASWLHRASVFVLPSYREGVPRSTLEAMACGLPVITTDVPGCRETVRDGRNGIVVPPRDVQALEEAMLRLCDDAELRAGMGAESRAFVLERFDSNVVNKEMARIMQISRVDVERNAGGIA